MNIFLSWSGDKSRLVAEKTKDFIQYLLQRVTPWISTHDIHKGTIWFDEINNQLAKINAGIVFLTNDNKNNPWILFESGALAKGLSSSRVYVVLVDLEPKDIQPPLSQFNATSITNKDDFRKLMFSINSSLDDSKLNEIVFEKVFNKFWDDFKAEIDDINKNFPVGNVPSEARSEANMLEEILYAVRGMGARVSKLENNNIGLVSNVNYEKLMSSYMHDLSNKIKNENMDINLNFVESVRKNNKERSLNNKFDNL